MLRPGNSVARNASMDLYCRLPDLCCSMLLFSSGRCSTEGRPTMRYKVCAQIEVRRPMTSQILDEWQAYCAIMDFILLGWQLYARASIHFKRLAEYRAWMTRDRQGRTECQTLRHRCAFSALRQKICSCALLGSKLMWSNTSTGTSSCSEIEVTY